MHRGLFIGLVTLDLIYLTEHIPHPNQKMVAAEALMCAGGPAANAAVAFSYLGNQVRLLTALGQHPLSALIRSDLAGATLSSSKPPQYQVEIVDLAPHHSDPPPTSSILVTQATGDRAVISINATQIQAAPAQIPPHILEELNAGEIEVVLIDGHQMAVSQAIAQQAHARQIPVVLDGGSWKPGLENILPWVDYAICSANFRPPGCQTLDQVKAYLHQAQVPYWAITQGDRPIQYGDASSPSAQTIPIPTVPVVDTLGSGDIFHGAFCHGLLQQSPPSFPEALAAAIPIAAKSCQYFGTRRWMIG